MSKIDNIEKLKRMKELSKLKAELHKRNALSYLPWNGENEKDGSVQKILQYGETGYSVFQLIRSLTKSETNETREANA